MDTESKLARALEPIRQESWFGSPPPISFHRAPPRTGTKRRILCALAITTATGLAYGSYHVLSQSWTASVTVKGKDVEVIYNGQVVPPEDVQWLPNGTCLVTINGARILLDPNQEGGAAATITVTEHEDPG